MLQILGAQTGPPNADGLSGRLAARPLPSDEGFFWTQQESRPWSEVPPHTLTTHVQLMPYVDVSRSRVGPEDLSFSEESCTGT